jgi:Tfp pilus assembly protein PilF
MPRIGQQSLPSPKASTRAGLVALLCLVMLAGCASGSKVQPIVLEKAPVVAEGPSVTRLQDGRDGFIILEIPSSNAEARGAFERAVVMMQAGEYGAAIPLLEKVIEQAPGVTAPYINLAMAYRQVGQPDKAEQSLQKALQLIPAHPVASNEYGLLLRKSGRFAEARTIYEKSLASFPDFPPARRNLGILCDLYLSDQACALEQYELYSLAVPKDEQVKLWVADLRVRLGR